VLDVDKSSLEEPSMQNSTAGQLPDRRYEDTLLSRVHQTGHTI